MRTLQGLTLGVIALALVLAATATAVGPVTITTTTYVVVGSTVPGVSTGLVLDGHPVTVTATGAVCPKGAVVCPGPNGDPTYNTTSSAYGGFPAPGAPAWGLVARVGGGPWTHVGSGPTTVSGVGELEFAVNDDYLGDNSGSFTVTVTSGSGGSSPGSGCTPGWGNGDENHTHSGPPGQTGDACRPGWGNGDDNHDHGGPPGQASAGTTETASTDAGPGNGNDNAKGHAKR